MKMTSCIRLIPTLAIAVAICTVSKAAILYDNSPGTTGLPLFPNGDASILTNEFSGVSWLAPVQFAQDVQLTGMDIFTNSNIAVDNQLVRIVLFISSLAVPDYSFVENIDPLQSVTVAGDTRDTIVIAHADFSAPINIAAGSFFAIGMSGETANLGLYGLDAGGFNAETMGLMQNGVPQPLPEPNGAKMAFRLHGNPIGVSDAGTTGGLLGLALFGIVLASRSRKATVR